MKSHAPFDPAGMAARKAAYTAYARQQAAAVFRPDGAYQPDTENDPRIVYWLYPLLVSAPDPAVRDLANTAYAAGTHWDAFSVFCTSAIAVNLARERAHMRSDLVARSEEHLARFGMAGGGRQPCAGCNDYMFHGYNDNMPAMAARTLILAGDLLDRPDHTDRGLFGLESLCAHFERRGLLSEYTSPTYTPITLTALMDIAECTHNRDAREMALACAQRVWLDLMGHWHWEIGACGGAQSRAYQTDATETASNLNALMWYLTGHRLCLDPIEVLRDPAYDGPLHHNRNRAFNLAGWGEMFSPDYALLPAAARAWAAAPRSYPYEFHATSDHGQSGLLGGTTEVLTRAFHQPLYCLGTASHTWFAHSGHQLALHGAAAVTRQPQSWRDRVAFWHRTQQTDAEVGDYINDEAKYHTLQRRGSALVLGTLGTFRHGKQMDALWFNVIFSSYLRPPDEHLAEGPWHFLRWGAVYIGVRMAGRVGAHPRPVVSSVSEGHLRIGMRLIETPTEITPEFREWCDFGYVLEIASEDECGSFAAFREQCAACAWEFHHGFYRSSRYGGRHGELEIVDSVATYSCRYMAIDGAVESRVHLAATGLDPRLTRLFEDGRRVRVRRLYYDPAWLGSPFNEGGGHTLASDVGGDAARHPGRIPAPPAGPQGIR